MTGLELKTEIKKSGLTQEIAAEKLGITRATLSNWCKQAELPPYIVDIVSSRLNINSCSNSSVVSLEEIIKSQQRTIENLSETIKNLTTK